MSSKSRNADHMRRRCLTAAAFCSCDEKSGPPAYEHRTFQYRQSHGDEHAFARNRRGHIAKPFVDQEFYCFPHVLPRYGSLSRQDFGELRVDAKNDSKVTIEAIRCNEIAVRQ